MIGLQVALEIYSEGWISEDEIRWFIQFHIPKIIKDHNVIIIYPQRPPQLEAHRSIVPLLSR